MAKVQFRARIKLKGINPYVIVSQNASERICPGWRRAMPVIVRVNTCPVEGVRTNLMPKGDGGFFLYLNAAMRHAAHLAVGDSAVIHLEKDANYRPGPTDPMPKGFKIALRSNGEASKGWEKLSPSRQKEILRYLAGLKSAATLQRNIANAVSVLAGRKARFMAREWN